MIRARIAVLTTTRADYGLLFWILREIVADPELDLCLYVTGSHLSPEFGLTVSEIEADGFPIRRRIEILLAADTPTAAAKAMALALGGFGEALAEDRPDVLILLGDRFEIVPVALAAVLHGVPVAHIHGGETSEGALDEYFRHAVTKLSTLHFPATEEYRRRIVQMGEAPERIHNLGAPGLDHLHRRALLSRYEMAESLGLALDRPTALVTYHPVTTEPGQSGDQVNALLRALSTEPNLQAVFTRANADAEGRAINHRIAAFCQAQPQRFRLVDSLGSLRYLSCLKHLDMLVGNSSSGLIEAPSFRLPVVNIGNRQKGRIAAPNVIQVGYAEEEIVQAIKQAMSAEFRDGLHGMRNPYDLHSDGRISARLVGAVKSFLSEGAPAVKRFHDLGTGTPDGQ